MKRLFKFELFEDEEGYIHVFVGYGWLALYIAACVAAYLAGKQ